MRIWTICDLVRKLLSAIFSLPLLDLIFLYLGRKPRYPCSTGLLLWWALTMESCGVSLIWNLGVEDPGKKNTSFSGKFPRRNFDFPGKLLNFQNNSIFRGTDFECPFFSYLGLLLNYHLQLHFGQVVHFLLKSHRFRTYILCKINYRPSNMLPAHDPSTTPNPKSVVATPKPSRIYAYAGKIYLRQSGVGFFRGFHLHLFVA